MTISVIIVLTHVPINVVQVIVYFKILSQLEYNVIFLQLSDFAKIGLANNYTRYSSIVLLHEDTEYLNIREVKFSRLTQNAKL